MNAEIIKVYKQDVPALRFIKYETINLAKLYYRKIRS